MKKTSITKTGLAHWGKRFAHLFFGHFLSFFENSIDKMLLARADDVVDVADFKFFKESLDRSRCDVYGQLW